MRPSAAANARKQRDVDQRFRITRMRSSQLRGEAGGFVAATASSKLQSAEPLEKQSDIRRMPIDRGFVPDRSLGGAIDRKRFRCGRFARGRKRLCHAWPLRHPAQRLASSLDRVRRVLESARPFLAVAEHPIHLHHVRLLLA